MEFNITEVEERIAEAKNLFRKGQHKKSEKIIAQIIKIEGAKVLKMVEPEVRDLIDGFFNKRKKRLSELFEEKLSALKNSLKDTEVRDFKVGLRSSLAELSQKHIFQWGSYYAGVVNDFLIQAVELVIGGDAAPVTTVLTDEFARHTKEIMYKGADYQGKDYNDVLTKSLGGLRSFLDLPIETYGNLNQQNRSLERYIAIRSSCSAILLGIIEGYGGFEISEKKGWDILPEYPRSWAHYLPFMTKDDFDRLLSQLNHNEFRAGLQESLKPLVNIIETFIDTQNERYFSTVLLSHFAREPSRRFEISLSLPPTAVNKTTIDIHCYVDRAYISRDKLSESAHRGASIILGNMPPDLQDYVDGDDVLSPIVADTNVEKESTEVLQDRCVDTLRHEMAMLTGENSLSLPLTVNFARNFPLNHPKIHHFYRVHRKSVREMIRTFEMETGVRTWCSVRRSGKTTACQDLDSTTGNSTIINQTCESTDRDGEKYIFYSKFEKSLDNEETLPSDFFDGVVKECMKKTFYEGEKVVFILDEYETLFDRLKLAVERNYELKYKIAQPLLNQLVSFSKENLLILVGQRPDAHYIIMDQNQLSPYVVQDTFPLFPHKNGELGSEFVAFLRKVLTERVEVSPCFADQIYKETSGHPFLTVNLLIVFCDWMIESKRLVTDLRVTEEDFNLFTEKYITRQELKRCKEYSFFKNFISSCMGESSKLHTPWLYVVLRMLKMIGERTINNKNIMYATLEKVYDEMDGESLLMMDFEQLLTSAEQANFFERKGSFVVPKIKLLGRLAGVSVGGG